MADRQVGIQFLALGEAEFTAALADALKQFDLFNDAVNKATDIADAFGVKWQRAFESFRAIGATPAEAMGGLEDAIQRGITPTQVLTDNQNKLFITMQSLALEGKNWNEIQEEMSNLAGKNTQETYKLGLAFFALSIAARGVRDIGKELGEIYGHDVTLAFQKVADTIQTIGSFGSAGALLGSAIPGVGTAVGAGVGAIIGVLAVLPQLLDQSSEATKTLVTTFDALANKQDAAKLLREVGDISAQTAQDLVKAASAADDYSQRIAADLDRVAKAKQEQENAKPNVLEGVLAGIGSSDPMGDLENVKAARDKQAQSDLDGAAAALKLDAAIVQVNQHYANSISTLEKLTGNTDDLNSVLKENAGATQKDTDAITAILKVHPEWGNDILQTVKNINELNVGLKDAPQYTDEYTKALLGQQGVLKDQIKLLSDLNAVNEKSSSLRSTLSKDGMGDDVSQLQALAGVTQDVANRFLSFAKSHEEVAAQASKLAERINDDQLALTKLRDEGVTSGDEFNSLTADMMTMQSALKSLTLSNQDYTDVLKQVADAQKKLADAMANASFATSQLTARTAEQHAAAQQQYQDAIDNASRSAGEAEANALQTRQDRLSDLWTSFSDKVVDINHNLAQKIEDIQTGLADGIASIQTTLNDAIANAEQQLADKLSNINQELANQKADLAHKYADTVAQDNQKITDAAQALADKLLEIERNRIQATEDLAFNTHEQIETAKTDHDKTRILENTREQQAVIDRNANNQARDAERSEKEQIDSINREKARAKQEYDYELSLAERAAAQKRAEAQRSFEEQIAAAQRTAAEQTAIAQRQAAEQTAIAKREAQDAADANKRSYDEQTAAAKRSYAEQIAAAQKAEADKMADARRSLDERNKAIDASAALEQAAINKTRDAAIKAYQEIMQHLTNLIGVIKAFMQVQLEAIGLSAFMAGLATGEVQNLFGNWVSGVQKLIGQGLTAGGSVTTPTPASGGTNNGSLLGRLAGGNSTVHAPVTSNSNRSVNTQIIINDATDVNRVSNIVRQTINDALRGNG